MIEVEIYVFVGSLMVGQLQELNEIVTDLSLSFKNWSIFNSGLFIQLLNIDAQHSRQFHFVSCGGCRRTRLIVIIILGFIHFLKL